MLHMYFTYVILPLTNSFSTFHPHPFFDSPFSSRRWPAAAIINCLLLLLLFASSELAVQSNARKAVHPLHASIVVQIRRIAAKVPAHHHSFVICFLLFVVIKKTISLPYFHGYCFFLEYARNNMSM